MLQSAADTAMRAPAWVAYVLLGLALVATVLGPRGQRAVNAAMLSTGVFVCAFFGLRGVGHAWVAPVTAVIAAVLAALFGVVADAWGTAALLGGLFAAAAGAGVAALKGPWVPVAAVAGSIGLFLGITRQRKIEILLPPLFAAGCAALGATIGWAPHQRGAILWRLNDVRWVLGLIAALAIPASIISSFTLMRVMGFTLNNMTLLGITLAVGIVIDDAIVVLENIFRYIEEENCSPYEAAIQGTREVALAVMATTLSLVVIFLPIAFMSGYAKRFINPFGWTMAFAIACAVLGLAFTNSVFA